MLQHLLARNTTWANSKRQADPAYFQRMAQGQRPSYFWIGCSDSRVPENVVGGLDPGEIFVHRNVANLVHSTDFNLLSALEFAIDVLGIREVIVCGHTGCGGVAAASQGLVNGLADHWLEALRRLARRNADDLAAFPEGPARNDRLAELSVIDAVERLAETPVLQQAWARGDRVSVHGLIYRLSEGELQNLDVTVTGAHLDRDGTG
jgi:carbonic anhydrase